MLYPFIMELYVSIHFGKQKKKLVIISNLTILNGKNKSFV